MTADTEPQAPQPVDPALLRVVRRVGIFHLRDAYARRDYDGVKKAAWTPFAAIRQRGIKNVEITLPDGTPVGLIAIKAGGKRYIVDDAELELVIAGNEPEAFHDVADPAALRDAAVIKLLAEHFPRYVSPQIKPDVLARYDDELKKNDGKVCDQSTGEFVRVASVAPVKPTGEYAVTWYEQGKGMVRLQEALDAGLIGMDGDDLTGDVDDSEPDPPAPAPPQDDVRERMDRALNTGTARPKHEPTSEQADIIEAVSESTDNLIIEAGAGTGKTTTLQQAAHATKASGYYLVFNAANAKEARVKFPRGVRVMTTCGLAMAAVGRPFAHRLNGGQVPAKQVAEILGIRMPMAVDGRIVSQQQQARLVGAMVKNFMISDATAIGIEHVPDKHGLSTPTAQAAVYHHLRQFADKAWDDLCDPDGKLKYSHDAYVKLWQLSNPQLPCDYVLLDEAQDTNAVVLAVLNEQKSTRLIIVGDSNQAIYEWRGAVNALDYFDGRRLQLSQSFRFGPAVAEQANKWLAVLESSLRLKGFDGIPSTVGELADADAILCRTNATAIAEAIRLLDAGVRVGVVGKMVDDLRYLADGAIDLKAGRTTTHPDLMAFGSWAEVQDHAENDPSGADLAVMVRLIDDHTPESIIGYIDRLKAETDADTVVATAHRTKGLEWDSVRIAGDFHPPSQDPEHPDQDPRIPADQARLAYVAVTRARKQLDATQLAWVDRFVPQASA